jgi:Calcineurin-like phosphoesterase
MRACAALAVFLVVTFAAPHPSAQSSSRLIAIGDIHGAYDEFVSILIRTGLVDAQQRWTGEHATLVQTGDFTDRGPGVRKVMDLLMTLEQKAKFERGEVVTLLGNHEVINIIGDLRYVTPEIVHAFVDGRSEQLQQEGWDKYAELAAARGKVRPSVPGVYKQTREQWMAAHPPGWLEYREALSPRGTYGKWLRGKQIATKIDGTIFMHAGINPDQPATVDQVNSRARDEIQKYEAFFQKMIDRKLALPSFTLQEVLQAASSELEAASTIMQAAKASGNEPDLRSFDVPLLRDAVEVQKIGDWSVLASEGPLWFRGYAQWSEADSAAKVAAFLDKSGVKRIVVGHTPQRDGRITPRFGGRVILIDTGMLTAVYNGKPSALELRDDSLKAIYSDGEMRLSPSTMPPIAAAR